MHLASISVSFDIQLLSTVYITEMSSSTGIIHAMKSDSFTQNLCPGTYSEHKSYLKGRQLKERQNLSFLPIVDMYFV